MANSVAKYDGQPLGNKQTDIDIYWKEFEAIEPTIQETQDDEDEPVNELEQDVEWLREAGFDEVVKRYRDSKEIKADHLALENITSSLTRKQADAVKRRINKLNANVKQRTSWQETSAGPALENLVSKSRVQHADIRSIFPTQTVGEASNQDKPVTTRRSYSEGVPVTRSQIVSYRPLRITRSQEHLNEIPVASPPVKVNIRGANVQAQIKSRPTVFTAPTAVQAGSRFSPKMKLRESAAYAVQLTGKGSHVYEDTHKTTQAQPSSISQGREPKTKKLGGSMFYVTATSTSSNPPNPPDKMKDLSVNDNWMLSDRKTRLSIEKQPDNPASKPEQKIGPPNHDEIDETTFKEVPVTNDKPEIESQKVKSDYETPPKFPGLPNFTLTRDEYGVTRIEDLSPHDMEKVRSLALIELTALFDSNNLVLNRRKPRKRKTKEHGIFGVPLLSLIQKDRGDNPKYNTPLILEEMVAFLENGGIKEEGILRVPGSAARVRNMREEIEETFPQRCFSWAARKPHDVAALLKQFLRELPFPLLTHEYQPTFASVEDIADRVQQLQALNLLVLLLPPAHRDTLRLLLLFLCHIITNRKENKMDLNNVAMIMAPNLFLNTGNKSRVTRWEVNMAKGTINIVRMLIKYHAILWTVPSFMVRQVRFLYEVNSTAKPKENKGKKRKAKRVPSSDMLTNNVNQMRKAKSLEELDRIEQEYENHIIRVKAPSLNKIGMAIQLTKDTMARDIVKKFCKTIMKNKSAHIQNSTVINHGHHLHKGNNCPCGEKHFLYEVGGNIGERCLDFETNLLKLSRLNPHAEWIIKTKD